MFEQFITEHLLAPEYLQWLWQGFLLTLWLSACAIVSSTLLGFVIAAARDSQIKPLRWLVTIYTTVFRNTPLLVQLFFWYFASGQTLPQEAMMWLNTPHEATILGLTLAWPSFEFLAGFIGLTLYSAPFVAEELRAGIQGVGRGQKYAAHALGLTGWQSMRHVVLPQALKIAMPPLLGQYMNIVKNSSLTMAIGVAELSYASRQVETETLKTFEAFGVATILYIAIIAVMEGWGQWRQQRTLARGY
ncbi:amino acid ABC transporter permease [Xenorhabdus nematophila]|uniref:amino acid ABC transporter permease n=1 Tax=Xenorhabdus nematophila TaxID=628 RepID=UPI00054210F5|nr:amino acid ABC transporter permease [Xenorhabdus nematophila]CEE90923.1 putative glutamate/aspartate transport protein (ABC superfamily, membrane) [Xenorhabdus nematophila str. Anatoliense]CEF30069.1 putative glutamate/aspartate transport protein (ABC superfamily, membrane) [Xenorhabdus nematophila str. Websteri]AYA41785.1 amino acid ABC transporter permease [Xenorhabdus nematophila]KHD29435.1 amino acid ABC transporter permease [Xenorhabdus nematophila]MBA0020515.1 amino acid ABC transport